MLKLCVAGLKQAVLLLQSVWCGVHQVVQQYGGGGSSVVRCLARQGAMAPSLRFVFCKTQLCADVVVHSHEAVFCLLLVLGECARPVCPPSLSTQRGPNTRTPPCNVRWKGGNYASACMVVAVVAEVGRGAQLGGLVSFASRSACCFVFRPYAEQETCRCVL